MRLWWLASLWAACLATEEDTWQGLFAQQGPKSAVDSNDLNPRLAREAEDALEAAYMQSYELPEGPVEGEPGFRRQDITDRKGKADYTSDGFNMNNNVANRANPPPKPEPKPKQQQLQVHPGHDSMQQQQQQQQNQQQWERIVDQQRANMDSSGKSKYLPDFNLNAKFSPPSFRPSNLNQGGLPAQGRPVASPAAMPVQARPANVNQPAPAQAQPAPPPTNRKEMNEERVPVATQASNLLPGYAYDDEATTSNISHYQSNDDIADFREFLLKKVSNEKEYLKMNRVPDHKLGLPSQNRVSIAEDSVPQAERGGFPEVSWHGMGPHCKQMPSAHLSRTVNRLLNNRLNKRVQVKGDSKPDAEESAEEESTESVEEEIQRDEEINRRSVAKGKFIKDKKVHLPEPIPYNQSHFIADIEYSMVPFRSPLLSLLDPARPAKYIMMKVNPVLVPGDVCMLKHRVETPHEADLRIEQTLIELVDRSINNELASAANGADLYGRNHFTNKIKSKMLKIPEFEKILQQDGEKAAGSPVSAAGQDTQFPTKSK